MRRKARRGVSLPSVGRQSALTPFIVLGPAPIRIKPCYKRGIAAAAVRYRPAVPRGRGKTSGGLRGDASRERVPRAHPPSRVGEGFRFRLAAASSQPEPRSPGARCRGLARPGPLWCRFREPPLQCVSAPVSAAGASTPTRCPNAGLRALGERWPQRRRWRPGLCPPPAVQSRRWASVARACSRRREPRAGRWARRAGGGASRARREGGRRGVCSGGAERAASKAA